MTYIIYTNDKVRGYGFEKRSEGFPARYEALVHHVCSTVSDPQGVEDDCVAIRYSPVDDRFLLSFIFRKPHGDADQPRGHNTVVNLLLSDEEADELFSRPTDHMLRQMTAYAAHLVKEPARWKDVGVAEPTTGWDDKLRVFGAVPTAELLAGAALSETMEGDRPKQLFVALDSDPLQELKTVMCHLPGSLRKRVCFHTGIISAQESRGIALNFVPVEKMRQIIMGNFNRAQSSDKFVWGLEDSEWSDSADVAAVAAHCAGIASLPAADVLYPLLMETVSDWTTWRAWRDVKEDASRLDCTLALLPADRVCQALSQSGISRAVLETLGRCRVREVAACANDLLRSMKVPVLGNDTGAQEWKETEKVPQAKAEKKYREKAPRLDREIRNLAAKLVRPAILLALLILLGFVLLGFIQTDTSAQDKTIILVMTASQLANVVRLLAAMGLTAAVTAMITAWVVKHRQGK